MSFVAPKKENRQNDDQVIAVGDQQVQSIAARDEEKMPLFLIKLWNIVEDPAYQQIVHWDESGYSFHIVDPYSFCRNVLPHYFKHNNLNSLIRQLNMYGFRKMTPLDRTGLTRAESDQDHLEFSHPYFVRDHPELLVNIKRKSSNRNDATTSNQGSLSAVTEELRTLREKQRNMDAKMNQLVKENTDMWEQISLMRAQHVKQQQVVTKLVQFLVALVQPSQAKHRIPKRGLLALDEGIPIKKARGGNAPQLNPMSNSSSLSEVLDGLQRQISEGHVPFRNRGSNGPIIADITEEMSPNVSQPPSTPYHHANANWPDMRSGGMGERAGPSSAINSHQMSNSQPSPGSMSPSNMNPTLTLSPSIDHRELQDYLSGIDAGIDNCRDILGTTWDLGEVGDLNGLDWLDEGNDGEQERQHQLALEGGVDPHDPLFAGVFAASPTPTLLTPSISPSLANR